MNSLEADYTATVSFALAITVQIDRFDRPVWYESSPDVLRANFLRKVCKFNLDAWSIAPLLLPRVVSLALVR